MRTPFLLTRRMSRIKRDETSNLFTLASDYDRESILLLILMTYPQRSTARKKKQTNKQKSKVNPTRDITALASGRIRNDSQKFLMQISAGCMSQAKPKKSA